MAPMLEDSAHHPPSVPSEGPAPVVSFIIPCRNEGQVVAGVVRDALASIAAMNVSGEVVVADNASTDDSASHARKAGARVASVPVPGYGSALAGGAAAARGSILVFCDADGSYDPIDAAPLVNAVASGHADLAMGNRLSHRLHEGAMPPLHQHVGTPALSLIARILFGARVTDINCGLRAIRRTDYEAIDPKTRGMEFASELVVKAAARRLRIAQYDVSYRADLREGDARSHLRPWRDGWRHLRLMIALAPTFTLAVPGAAVLALALAAAILLAIRPVRIGSVSFDVHTLLIVCGMALGGFQTVGLAATARAFAASQGLGPIDGPLGRLFRAWTIERGLVAAALIGAAGLWPLIGVLVDWSRTDFGPLDVAQTLRPVILAVTLLLLAFQVAALSIINELVSIPHR